MFSDAPEMTEATEATEKPRFVIDSEDRANWVLRKLANNRAELARVKANAAKRVEELEADHNDLMGRFGPQLEEFARGEAERRRRQTITLEQGTLSFRKVAARLVIGDVATAMTTARAIAPETIKEETVVNTTFDKDGFLQRAQAILEETGEIIVGVTMTEASQKFSVKVTNKDE